MYTTIDTVENGQTFISGFDEYTMAGKAIVGNKVRVLVDPGNIPRQSRVLVWNRIANLPFLKW